MPSKRRRTRGQATSAGAGSPAAHPCPFCASTDILFTWTERDEQHVLFCRHCEACGPPAPTPEEALQRWNAAGSHLPQQA